MARFCPLFSGSSGNCIYIGSGDEGILIDAGMSAKRITQALRDRDIDPLSIRGIFVTHEHSDHTRGLRVLQKQLGVPVFASYGTCEGLLDTGAMLPEADCRVEERETVCAGMRIIACPTPHDCNESVGYTVETPDERRIAVFTDMGHITEEVSKAMAGSDLVLIESNHDVRMLESGRYPYPLKRRILSDIGHLSNEVCAAALPGLVNLGARRLFLGHLSKENNTPALAFVTAKAALEAAGMTEGIDYLLRVAPREDTEPVMRL